MRTIGFSSNDNAPSSYNYIWLTSTSGVLANKSLIFGSSSGIPFIDSVSKARDKSYIYAKYVSAMDARFDFEKRSKKLHTICDLPSSAAVREYDIIVSYHEFLHVVLEFKIAISKIVKIMLRTAVVTNYAYHCLKSWNMITFMALLHAAIVINMEPF